MMRTGIAFTVTAAERRQLQALVAAAQTPQKHVWRCQIILATDDGLGTNAIQAHAGTSKATVWRWQQRFMAERVQGLLYDKTRPPGKAPTPGATHWTVRAMAREMDLHPSVVHMIWRRHGLAPHRCRQFKVSTDPHFARKARDVIGLYMAPPDHALVLSVDEKTQIQALSRTQAGLPMRAGQPATQTHDYQRHGTTTLFAALDVQTGQVAGQMCPRHRQEEFLDFLDALATDVPATQPVHVILDNYSTHRTASVQDWLAAHPRWTFHFTPTSSS